MGILDFVADYWWLVFPLGGVVGGAVGGIASGVSTWDKRRRKHKIELARIKYGARAAEVERDDVSRRTLDRTRSRHDAVDRRWLDYELDIAKLIDHPLMTDMREPLTVDFHQARRDADALRPDEDGGPTDPELHEEYRQAVRRYETAFDVAEQEARRRQTSDFSVTEQQALLRAKKFLALAEDGSATYAERQTAYRRATRELGGLVVLPTAATDAVEHRIAGAIDAPADGARRDT
ncbi:hypothetical protein ACPYO6_06465 [Georgenia sp. Z1344]|uniref:hypothetical protein n=1 Tax=Georgenia sp. Z1344 TaxID=3416706 RepID=UPI003CEDBEE7